MKPLMTPFEGTQKLNANTDFAKKPAAKPLFEAYLQNYKNADPLTRKYMDGISAFSESYGNPTIGGKLTTDQMMGNYALAANPFTEQPPASAGSAPNANNFPGGASDRNTSQPLTNGSRKTDRGFLYAAPEKPYIQSIFRGNEAGRRFCS